MVTKDFVLPPDIQYATYFNRDRDAINTALFEERCRDSVREHGHANDSIIIFCDQLMVLNGSNTYVPFKNPKIIWECCGEDDILKPNWDSSGRMDPALKLYVNMRVMLPHNANVTNGEAKGTRARVQKVVLKHNEQIHRIALDDSVVVNACYANQVSYVELRHENDRISPSIFRVVPKDYDSFKARIPRPGITQTNRSQKEKIQMKAQQIPLLANSATTGHKLQGSGVDSLFVHNWSYITNWVYVMLSRVRTCAGLYCRVPLSLDLTKYKCPASYKKLVQDFRSSCAPVYFTDAQYSDLFP